MTTRPNIDIINAKELFFFRYGKDVYTLKKHIIKAVCAAAMTLTLTGCGMSDVIYEILETYEPATEISVNEDYDNSDILEERIEFTGSGTRMSMTNGELQISRRSRTTETSMGGDDWTILVYMCGTDLESRIGAATTDIIESINGRYSDHVNIIFQTGGTAQWQNNIVSSDRIQRYIRTEDNIRLVDEQPLSNMGDPATLSSFIEWGAANYPAENMGLIMWNHGGGSISGICFDERHNMDSLSLKELDKALSDSYDSMTEKFEFIGFDACLMATLETANVLVPYANYMFASEETEPGGGWNYTAIMDYLVTSPEADGAMLGELLCESYYAHCAEYRSESDATLAAIDLSKIDALLTSFNMTAQEMYETQQFADVIKSILKADDFGGNNRNEGYTNMVDLGGILSGVSAYCPNAADTLAKLDEAVVYKKNGRGHSAASGLSVYYPLSVQGAEELSIFSDICPSTYYLAFVDKAAYGTTGYDVSAYDNTDLLGDFLDIWDIGYTGNDYSCNTDSFESISEGTIPVSGVYFDEDGIYTVALSDLTNLSYAACSLFLEDTDGSSIYLGSDDEVLYDLDNGIITDNFDGSWISLPDGQLLPIEVVSQTEDYSVYTCSVLLNGEVTNLRIEYDWNAERWNVLGAWAGIDENGMAARDVIELKDGDIIQPVYYYIQGESEDYFAGNEYVVNGVVELSYDYLPAADYVYSITLYDIYGNWYFTPSVTFTIDENGELWFYPEELEQTADGSGDYEDIFGFSEDDWSGFFEGILDSDSGYGIW